MLNARSTHFNNSGSMLSTSFRYDNHHKFRPASKNHLQETTKKKKKRHIFSKLTKTNNISETHPDLDLSGRNRSIPPLYGNLDSHHMISAQPSRYDDNSYILSQYSRREPIVHSRLAMSHDSFYSTNRMASPYSAFRLDSLEVPPNHYQIPTTTWRKDTRYLQDTVSRPDTSPYYQRPNTNCRTNPYISNTQPKYSEGMISPTFPKPRLRRSRLWANLHRLGEDFKADDDKQTDMYDNSTNSTYDDLPETSLDETLQSFMDTFSPLQGTQVLIDCDNALRITQNAADLYSRNMREGWYIDQGHWIDCARFDNNGTRSRSLPRNLENSIGNSVPLVHTVLTDENQVTCQNVVCTSLRKKYYSYINGEELITAMKKCETEIKKFNSNIQIIFRDSFATNQKIIQLKFALEKKLISAFLLVACQEQGYTYMPQYIPACKEMFQDDTTLSEQGKAYSLMLLQENLYHMPIKPYCHVKVITPSPFAYFLNQPKFRENTTPLSLPTPHCNNISNMPNFVKEETKFEEVPIGKINRILIGGTDLDLLVDNRKYYIQEALGVHVICVPHLSFVNISTVINEFFTKFPTKHRSNIKQIIIQLNDQLAIDMKRAYESIMMCKNYHHIK